MLTVVDIKGRKMVQPMHIDYARGSSAWLGGVDGIPRLGVAKGHTREGPFTRWYVDSRPVRNLEAALAVLNGEMTLEAAMQPDRKPTQKFSLTAQIDEVERELKMRDEVYPRQVRSGSLRPSLAEYQMERMKAVLATLQWLRENETDVRAYVGAKAAMRKHAAETQGDAEQQGNAA